MSATPSTLFASTRRLPRAPSVQRSTSQCLRSDRSKNVTTFAVGVIAAVCLLLGALAVLASSGTNVGAFNSLSGLSVGGGMGVAIVSGMVFIAAVSWLISQAVQRCRSAHRQNRVFSFPNGQLSSAHYAELDYPACFTAHFGDNPKPKIARAQAVSNPHGETYLATHVSLDPNAHGSWGTTPYVLAWAPMGQSTTPPTQKECFQEMVATLGASIVVILDPVTPNKECSPAILSAGESLRLGDTTISCSSGGKEFAVRKVTLKTGNSQSHYYQCTAQTGTMFSSPQAALAAICNLKKSLSRCAIVSERPMIIAANEGKNTGAFLALWELMEQLEGGTCIDATLADSLLALAKHIEKQSWPGSAVSWINQMWSEQFNDDQTYLVELQPNTQHGATQLTEAQKDTIAQTFPSLVGSRRRGD